MKFKVGDRVRSKGENQIGTPYGLVGTIINIDGDIYGVSYDGFTGGHWLDGRLPRGDKSGWRCNEHQIELYCIEPPEDVMVWTKVGNELHGKITPYASLSRSEQEEMMKEYNERWRKVYESV
jgi:hypothetical protein